MCMNRYDVAHAGKEPTLHRKAQLKGGYDAQICNIQTRQVCVWRLQV